MIEAHQLTRRFGRILAVDAVNFTVPEGRVVGFLGPNGAGKSTTIRMISGYLPPTSGRVSVCGIDVVRNRRAVAAKIGYLPESAPLYLEMRVIEYLRFRAKLFGVPAKQRSAAVSQALRRCWLDNVAKRPIGQLSKGYRQRVGLAASLLHDPPVLILDEPTVGLDPTQIREVRSLIRELAGEKTILLSTHILPEVERTCDHIIMIARGRIRHQGSIDDLTEVAASTARYVIETDSNQALPVVRDVAGIAEVEEVMLDGAWRRLTVASKPGAPDAREAIASALSEAGAAVRELRREATSLEQVFVGMIAESESDRTADEAEAAA